MNKRVIIVSVVNAILKEVCSNYDQVRFRMVFDPCDLDLVVAVSQARTLATEEIYARGLSNVRVEHEVYYVKPMADSVPIQIKKFTVLPSWEMGGPRIRIDKSINLGMLAVELDVLATLAGRIFNVPTNNYWEWEFASSERCANAQQLLIDNGFV